MGFNLYFAPIMGVVTYTYRNAYHKIFKGIDKYFSPFIPTVKANSITNKIIADVLPENNKSINLIPQLIGKSGDEFIVLANALHDIGYNEINWNMGCPYPRVTKKGRGSGLLQYPDLIRSILEQIMPVLKSKLSIKVRLGKEAPDEIFKVIEIFNDFQLEELIIHPRTGSQMYEGTVDLIKFEEVMNISRNKVVYNGDVVSLTSFNGIKEKFFNINDWMIGRGIMVNPFLPEIIKGIYIDNYDKTLERLKLFHDELYVQNEIILSGDKHLEDKMKGIWNYMADIFENGNYIKKEILRTKNKMSYQTVVTKLFKQKPSFNKSLFT